MDDLLLEVRNDVKFNQKGVFAMAVSDRGKLAAVRKIEIANAEGGCTASTDADAVVEQYNVLAPNGAAILETVHSPASGAIECLTWVGDRIVVGHISGAVSIIQPHTVQIRTTQVCPAPLWACCSLPKSSSLCAFVSHSAQLLLLDIDSGETTLKKHLGIDQRLFSVCANDNLIAVGASGSIFVLDHSENLKYEIQLERADRQLPTIAWSVCFAESRAGPTLACGDSRGRLTFWNATSGAQLRQLETHQADILALQFVQKSGRIRHPEILAAGVDPRIVVIENRNSNVWEIAAAVSGPSCDVRSLCVLDNRIFAAGCDSVINADLQFSQNRRKSTKPLPTDFSSFVLSAGKFTIIRGSNFVDVWTSGTSSGTLNDSNEVMLAREPVCLARINAQGGQYVTACALSPCGRLLCISTGESTRAFKLRISKTEPVRRIPFSAPPATAITFANKHAIMAINDFRIHRYDIESTDENGVEIIEQFGTGIVTRIACDPRGNNIAVLTTRSQVFFINTEKNVSALIRKIENTIPSSIAISSSGLLSVLHSNNANSCVLIQFHPDAPQKPLRSFQRFQLFPQADKNHIIVGMTQNSSSSLALVDHNGRISIITEDGATSEAEFSQAHNPEDPRCFVIGWKSMHIEKPNIDSSVLSIVALPVPPPTQPAFRLKKYGEK